VLQGLKAHRELRAELALQGLKVRQDQLVQPALQEPPVLRGLQVLRVPQVLKGLLESLVHLAVLKDLQVLLVSKALQDPRDFKVSRVRPEPSALQELEL
jgi:hypothetical protein